MWVIHPITADEAHTIADWRYPIPYDVYNVSGDPSSFLIPDHHYHSVFLRDELAGFFCLGQDARVPGGSYDDQALDIGLGMRPDLIGQGLGSAFFGAVLAFIPPTPLRLTVAAFNERAKRLYERFDFHVSHRFCGKDGLTYLQMVRPLSADYETPPTSQILDG